MSTAAIPSSSESITRQTNGISVDPKSTLTRTSKNAKRRAKKKQHNNQQHQDQDQSQSHQQDQNQDQDGDKELKRQSKTQSNTDPNPDFSSTSTSTSQYDDDQETFQQFAHVFAKFNPDNQQSGDGSTQAKTDPLAHRGEILYSDDDGSLSDSSSTPQSQSKSKSNQTSNQTSNPTSISKRRLKKLSRLTVSELKQMVSKPELVEYSDVNSHDPKLLIGLKSLRNSIPIPPHWSLKRDYLQNKRGIEKPEYRLPSYIADTGISTMKDALKEKESSQSLKSKTRERVQPKMGKIDIDYQKLHDAFFRFQVAPNSLTPYGEVYFEGKENEIKSFSSIHKPGQLSKELSEALSIPNLAPPPWLIAMQRFGPPPNYPGLKIKGLNDPIPEGAQWGYHPGGWGRPPMNEFGQPIFPQVMGPSFNQGTGMGIDPNNPNGINHLDNNGFQNPLDTMGGNGNGNGEEERSLWGELESDDEEEDDDESEQEEDGRDEREQDTTTGGGGIGDGLETPMKDGLETPRSESGVHSVTSTLPGGLETPGFMELRKDVRSSSSNQNRNNQDENDENENDDKRPKELYHVIKERQTSINGQGMMGSDRVYDLSRDAQRAGATGNAPQVLGREERGTKRKHASDVSLTLDPSELESLSQAEIQERYEAARKAANAQQSGGTIGVGIAGDREELTKLREELSRRREGGTALGDGKKKKGGGGEREERYRF